MKTVMITRIALLPLSLLPATSARQASPPAAQDCRAAEHRQFDFWLGTWDVTEHDKPAGTNTIEADLKGCVVVEHWTSARGGHGTSLNFFDRRTKAWYQTWIDEQGGALRLKGGLDHGRMVMQSEPMPNSSGGSSIEKITWSPEADGTVRQLWQSSADHGKTWSVAFDGRYRRKK
jgi:hypothetical protein